MFQFLMYIYLLVSFLVILMVSCNIYHQMLIFITLLKLYSFELRHIIIMDDILMMKYFNLKFIRYLTLFYSIKFSFYFYLKIKLDILNLNLLFVFLKALSLS